MKQIIDIDETMTKGEYGFSASRQNLKREVLVAQEIMRISMVLFRLTLILTLLPKILNLLREEEQALRDK